MVREPWSESSMWLVAWYVCFQELAWNERLRTKEVARMEELEKVFLDKEKERKGLFARSQEEYHRLESKLRKSLMGVGR